MGTARIAAAIALLMLGTVWVGQGLGYIRGSFMTGSRTWLVIGLVLDIAALGMLVAPRVLRRS